MKRIYSIDVLRGIVMIIMALDHVRDLMHVTSITEQPTNLATTTPALFFTRWITYLCAPTFVFLAGTSAFLSLNARNDIAATRRFLFTRGLWLIVLEFTVVNFGLWFDIRFTVFLFNVIAAIGFGFIVLSLLLKLPVKAIGCIGLAIICLHNLAPLVPGAETTLLKKIGMPLLSPTAFPFGNGKMFVMGYPPIPWLGIMLVGFAFGKIWEAAGRERSKICLRTGLAAILLFLLIRGINGYGDGVAWSAQQDSTYTLLSFLNVTKYPPSLDFTLLFLGLMLVLLAYLEGMQNRFTAVAAVFGQVPLFYFIVHFYLIHVLVFLMLFLQGFGVSDMVFGFNFGRPMTGSGLSLWAVYLVWIGVVALMYPLCKWYGNYKAAHKSATWLRYL
ncbi:MAG: DUF1624 domain-containing protein [Chitinophagaceae bacterium]|nr:DUF1624 domain-containing protein [Chitinophagaceae bacterium]